MFRQNGYIVNRGDVWVSKKPIKNKTTKPVHIPTSATNDFESIYNRALLSLVVYCGGSLSELRPTVKEWLELLLIHESDGSNNQNSNYAKINIIKLGGIVDGQNTDIHRFRRFRRLLRDIYNVNVFHYF